MTLTRSALPSLLLAAAATTAQAGEPTYTFVDLGTLGGPESVANGLNDARQVVGWSSIAGCTVNGHPCRRAFLWDGGTLTDLGLLAGDEESVARAINASGLIVGTSESDVVAGSGTFHGVTWSGGAPVALPDLGGGQCFPTDVNGAGVIAGWAPDPMVLRDRAVTWEAGAIANVGKSESHESNRAIGINEAGELVGFAWNLFQPNDSVLFDLTDWFTIGGIDGPFQNSEASDLNDAGLAVGLQAFPSGSWHAAMWDFSSGAIDLGVLPGDTLAELYDVNDAGLAVGRSYLDVPPFTSRAVLADGGQLLDLNAFLAKGIDVTLYEAREINEQGDIAGTALLNGAFHAFLMISDATLGPWNDLGNSLAGSGGLPSLVAQGSLEAGSLLSLSITNGNPGGAAFLVLGLSQANLPTLGGTLVPSPDVVVGPLPLDADGKLSLALTWPAGFSGLETHWQTWIPDPAGPAGWSATNAVRGTAP